MYLFFSIGFMVQIWEGESEINILSYVPNQLDLYIEELGSRSFVIPSVALSSQLTLLCDFF